MTLSRAQQTLLESARAEAKKAGQSEVALIHLAAALASREQEAFERLFGPSWREQLRKQLREKRPLARPHEAEEFLAGVGTDNVVGMIEALHEGHSIDLSSEEVESPGAPEPAISAEPERGSTAAPGGLLERLSPDASIVARDSVVAELIALLGRHVPATPLVVGPAGGGNSAVAVALATRLADPEYSGPLAGVPVVRVRATEVLSQNPISALARAFDSAPDPSIVVVDDVEVLTGIGSGNAILPMLARLRAAVEDRGVRMMLIVEERFAARLDVADEELAAELTRVAVPPLAEPVLDQIGQQHAESLSKHHGVELPEAVARAAQAGARGERRSHPALLIERLDMACARAASRADRVAVEADLGVTAAPDATAAQIDGLAERLGERVHGQDHAIARVSSRLLLTRARLDLRPERPDGVFLFVGPTGVGKTELARAICAELFGDEERMIRIDMSEYAHDWALSRLIGPQPGYVGFNEPESWLTTRIAKNPDTVLLLDEIEKAHPTVWNAFLQVFDSGRLSDARGNVADFSRTVVAMTSNLGAHAFKGPQLGFAGGADDTQEDDRVVDAIKTVMSPELINRLDEVIVFRPLSPETIRSIAAKEAEAAVTRLGGRGYEVEVPDSVIDLLAESGYDPAYGARHLQRNIERLLLQPLAAAGAHSLRAVARDGEVVLEPV